jgi:hypothetical protein
VDVASVADVSKVHSASFTDEVCRVGKLVHTLIHVSKETQGGRLRAAIPSRPTGTAKVVRGKQAALLRTVDISCAGPQKGRLYHFTTCPTHCPEQGHQQPPPQVVLWKRKPIYTQKLNHPTQFEPERGNRTYIKTSATLPTSTPCKHQHSRLTTTKAYISGK